MMLSSLAQVSRRIPPHHHVTAARTMSTLPFPAITVFTSIASIAPALRQQQQNRSFQLEEIVDDNALNGYGSTVHFDAHKLSEASVAALRKAEILVTEPHVLAKLMEYESSEEPQLLCKLKWCQSTYAGVDPIFKSLETARGSGRPLTWPPPFLLTRFAGVFGPPMAEWCIGRIVAHERNFLVSHSDQLSGQWAASKSVFEYRYLSEMTLTVLGSTGDIGKCIGKAAKAFGMNVVGYSRSGGRDGDDETCFDEQVTDLTTALQAADYIVAVLPSTDATRGLLTLDKLQTANAEAGGRSPVLINVGRGDLVSSETLTRALDEGHLSAVILDVMDPEPLPPDSPLWKHPKVTISPHVSALTRGKDVPKVILQQYKHYCHAVAQNEDNKIGKDSISAMTAIASSLNYVVDWNKGY